MTITVSDDTALDITGSMTVECWASLKPNTNDVHALISKAGIFSMVVGVSDSNNPGFKVYIGDGTNYTYSLEDTQVWIDDHWHHFAFSFVDNTRARLYVGGNLVKEDTSVSTSLSTNANDLLFGEDTINSWTLNGVLDGIRLWSDERTQSEIDDQRHVTLTGNEGNLNGYWPLDDGSGSTANDATANDNDGTLASDGDWVQRTTDNTGFFRSPTGEADLGLSQPLAARITGTDNYGAGDGTVRAYLDVSVPELPRKAKKQRVIFRRNGSNEWRVADDLFNSDNRVTVRIDELSPDVQYEVATKGFSSVSSETKTILAENSPFTTEQKSEDPADVQNLTASQEGKTIYLSWDAVPDKDVRHYDIRRRSPNSGTSWSNAKKETPSVNTEQRISLPKDAGDVEFLVKAVDTSENESTNFASVTVGMTQSPVVITSDTTFVVPPATTTLLVSGTGAGAGGGGSLDNQTVEAGGGGAGENVLKKIVNVTPGESISINLGTGGSGGSGGSSPNNGSDGGTTTFGSYLSLSGGQGGEANNNSGKDGTGGLSGGGWHDMAPKSKGQDGEDFTQGGGSGAPSLFGSGGLGGGKPNNSNNNGNDGEKGAGGGGAIGGTSNNNGGAGGDGFIIIEF